MPAGKTVETAKGYVEEIKNSLRYDEHTNIISGNPHKMISGIYNISVSVVDVDYNKFWLSNYTPTCPMLQEMIETNKERRVENRAHVVRVAKIRFCPIAYTVFYPSTEEYIHYLVPKVYATSPLMRRYYRIMAKDSFFQIRKVRQGTADYE